MKSSNKLIEIHPSLKNKADELSSEISCLREDNPEETDRAILTNLATVGTQRLEQFLNGIVLYRHHPYQRHSGHDRSIKHYGESQLINFGADHPEAPAVLLIPSLVNRSYILDLQPENSFALWLKGKGYRPYLLEWGSPLREECHFTMTDYIKRLDQILMDIHKDHRQGVHVIGYCMGGLLALANALRNTDRVYSLSLLATPWDFHADQIHSKSFFVNSLPGIQMQIEQYGFLPTDFLQGFFSSLDPLLAFRKFSRFAEIQENVPAAELFVALEDWLNDGVPLAGPVAQECLKGWYIENRPYLGKWQIDDELICPEKLEIPVLCLVPKQDRIVPPKSAIALAKRIPNASVIEVPAGHIGMMAGKSAATKTWPQIDAFLSNVT